MVRRSLLRDIWESNLGMTLVAVLIATVCAALAPGPDEWPGYVISKLELIPLHVRTLAFVTLGAIALVFLGLSSKPK